MILHKLILQHVQKRDDEGFYIMQARDAIRWLLDSGLVLNQNTSALDLGCGHGIFGGELLKLGCPVVFADETNYLQPHLRQAPFHQINIDQEPLAKLGRYDLVICSNVYEHLARPQQFLENAASILNPGGHLFLSWTNWLSPWGGHEFSPFHYLGPHRGHRVYDKIVKRKRFHTPHVNLFPTYIGDTLSHLRQLKNLEIVKMAPRYYTELAFLTHIPWLREFLTWNCAMIIRRNER